MRESRNEVDNAMEEFDTLFRREMGKGLGFNAGS